MVAISPVPFGFVRLSQLFAALFALHIAPTVAAADTYRVVGVRPGDVLNIRTGPSARYPVIGQLARDERGVEGVGECMQRWCPVRSGFTLGWASARYLEREGAHSEPTAVGATELAPDAVVLADGTIEVRYPDGRIRRRLPDGRSETKWPDGTISGDNVRIMQVPIADLPPLPGMLGGWGDGLSASLFGVLENILTEAELEAYRQTEAGKSFYEVLDWRLTSIRFLTMPDR